MYSHSKYIQLLPIFTGVTRYLFFRYGKGDWTQDILIVAKPSFQITTNPHEKIIPVSNLNDDELKGGQGYNPNHDEKFYPYIDKRTLRNKALNDSIDDFKRYDKFKWDMRTQAFAMGPGMG